MPINKNHFVKFLEFSTLIGFLLAYWKYDLQAATLVLMVLMSFFVASAHLLQVKLPKLQWVTWGTVMVLGSITLISQNDLFIKWKPTLVNAILVLGLGASQIFGKKTIMERMFSQTLPNTEAQLRRINLAAIVYLFFVGVLNIFVAYTFSSNTWMWFKYLGLFILNSGFIAGCFYYLREPLKHYIKTMNKKG